MAKNHSDYELSPELKKRVIDAVKPTYPTTEIVVLVLLTVLVPVAMLACCCAGYTKMVSRPKRF